eukprot:gene25974-11659_t
MHAPRCREMSPQIIDTLWDAKTSIMLWPPDYEYDSRALRRANVTSDLMLVSAVRSPADCPFDSVQRGHAWLRTTNTSISSPADCPSESAPQQGHAWELNVVATLEDRGQSGDAASAAVADIDRSNAPAKLGGNSRRRLQISGHYGTIDEDTGRSQDGIIPPSAPTLASGMTLPSMLARVSSANKSDNATSASLAGRSSVSETGFRGAAAPPITRGTSARVVTATKGRNLNGLYTSANYSSSEMIGPGTGRHSLRDEY